MIEISSGGRGLRPESILGKLSSYIPTTICASFDLSLKLLLSFPGDIQDQSGIVSALSESIRPSRYKALSCHRHQGDLIAPNRALYQR